MENLHEQIKQVNSEIDKYTRKMNYWKIKISRKKAKLEYLEKLTVNQISMEDTDGFS